MFRPNLRELLGNIVVECKKRDGRRHATSQLLVVAASLGLLSFFTINAMRGSYEAALLCQEGISCLEFLRVEMSKRSQNKIQIWDVPKTVGLLFLFKHLEIMIFNRELRSWGMDTAAEDEVNGWITLGFALGNMVFDCICLLNFLKSHRQTGDDEWVGQWYWNSWSLGFSATRVQQKGDLTHQLGEICFHTQIYIYIYR